MKYIKPSLIIFITNTNKKQFFKISNFWRFVSFIRILLVFVYLLQTYFCIYYFCILFLLVCFFWKISVSILCLFLQPSFDTLMILFCYYFTIHRIRKKIINFFMSYKDLSFSLKSEFFNIYMASFLLILQF